MALWTLSGKGEVQIMSFWKLSGKCHFLLRFCTRNWSETYKLRFTSSFQPYSIAEQQLTVNKMTSWASFLDKKNWRAFMFWTCGDSCPGFKIQEGCPHLYTSSLEHYGILRFICGAWPVSLLAGSMAAEPLLATYFSSTGGCVWIPCHSVRVMLLTNTPSNYQRALGFDWFPKLQSQSHSCALNVLCIPIRSDLTC